MAETFELAPLAAAFSRELHDAGVPGTPERAVRFARALELAPPHTRRELYWTGRVVFVSAHEQIPTFDAVFDAVFGGGWDTDEARGDPSAPPTPGPEAARHGAHGGHDSRPAPPAGAEHSPRLGDAGGSDAAGEAREATLAAASSEERLHQKSFDRLDENELLALRDLMRRLAIAPPERRSRRARAGRRGERIDVRATLRRSRHTAGDPVHLARRRRRMRPRRLVVLCDISGSMEPYSRAFIQFLHGSVTAGRAEAFVFATRLTRLTRVLSSRQPQLAIDMAAAAAPDWAGGTRIGEALREFNDRYGRRGLARGAVVVIVSDGWERDDPALVAREMERLRRLAHRIIWVNPRKASPAFAPLAQGMAAALPYCDELMSGHSLSALNEVAEAIRAV